MAERRRCSVVALGASAGGLSAFETVLSNIPPGTGLAFVFVQHLDPTHDSRLVELLAKSTSMPVVQIEDGMELSPDRVHVIPPDAFLSLSGTTLRLAPRLGVHPWMPIDTFLRALAEEQGRDAIAVILSGTGSDGALGVEAIRRQGGITMAQEPDEASFAGMPRSAIDTGCVDLVLPSDELGEELGRIAHEPLGAREGRRAAFDASPDDEAALSEALALLRAATGVDFHLYRQTTVRRRLHRRVVLRGLVGVPEYVTHLRSNPGELQDLAQDLLIPVTHFFRDPWVFDFVQETVFPEMLRRAAPGDVVRLWVPGCSTGEEAYSLAICFLETAKRLQSQASCQIFATDVNEAVLEKARRAIYPDAIAADMSPMRLARFFTRTGEGYRLNREVRELCVFSRHDLLNDPPLSRMDLVSCRNLLIYLDSMQRQVLSAFHFALEARGYLLLGRSESTAAYTELFEVVDGDSRLYRSRSGLSGRAYSRPGGARDPRIRAPSPVPVDADATAYEELTATNEELQSLNEELESSKEEMESVNEELQTLNHELRSRNSALQVANEFAQATLDTVHGSLVVLDREGVVVNANRSFYKSLRRTATEVERHRLADVAPEYFTSPALSQLLDQVRTSGVGQDDVEIELDLPDHEHRVFLVNARPFAPGNLFLLSLDDITDLRRVESERSQSQKMDAIGHLAAGVAHDFNNLLTVILSSAELAASSLPADASAHAELTTLVSAARRAAELTRQLLAYSGKGRHFLESVDLSDLVAQAASLLHGSLPAHLQLRLNLERNLPRLLVDQSQIHQVVSNLLTNAVEAMETKAGTVTISTGRQVVTRGEVAAIEPGRKLRPGPYLYIEVQDQGVGMSEEIQRKMFDPFFSTKFTGRGLGLAAVQGVVRQQQGAILVHSLLGRGTAIRVLFAVMPLSAPTASAAAVTLPRMGATILVVDDEPLVRATTQGVLQRLGYSVVTASGGLQAIERVRAMPEIALVILDAVMPGMDGPKTLEAVEAARPGLPILVCSGVGEAAVEASFSRQRVVGFLHKPFSVHDLAEQLLIALKSPS